MSSPIPPQLRPAGAGARPTIGHRVHPAVHQSSRGPDPQRLSTLVSTPVVQLGDSECLVHDAACGALKCTTGSRIVFTRRGMHIRHVGRRKVLGDVNTVAFFNEGDEYRASHPTGQGDTCTWLLVEPTVLTEIGREYDSHVADCPHRPFRFEIAPIDSRSYLLHTLLHREAERGESADRLALEEGCLRLAQRAIASAHAVTAHRVKRRDTDAAHAEATEAARELLAARSAEPWTITGLSRALHVSPFHLCRVFKERSGMTIHRYLNRLRLRGVLERLLERRDDLTSLALEQGYSSHSHFSATFRREFGLSPSAVRGSTTRTLREMSKMLTA